MGVVHRLGNSLDREELSTKVTYENDFMMTTLDKELVSQ